MDLFTSWAGNEKARPENYLVGLDKDAVWKTLAGQETRSLNLFLDTAMIALSDLHPGSALFG